MALRHMVSTPQIESMMNLNYRLSDKFPLKPETTNFSFGFTHAQAHLDELLLLSARSAVPQESLGGYERLEHERRRDIGYTRKSKVHCIRRGLKLKLQSVTSAWHDLGAVVLTIALPDFGKKRKGMQPSLWRFGYRPVCSKTAASKMSWRIKQGFPGHVAGLEIKAT
ncbi:hypothetical protein CONPUDRAFT_76380 [Coniophora puteana RWD-64-598 SS2]|uniref:Uncharacterized protein n=1 Tax=Coniophora puteana (strain RWD-64-598) TaxID=741705 RepID=A0A5M3MC71_CONPW|nr:uncharacterized protein CONPUDRAFT_76380 [Coniophora puteana RWD-64-598 SS2]EIW76809.1 hypothetical protein CONPUDRAFT_76380 [Coniophora puteana RWD-64-598 SS2]